MKESKRTKTVEEIIGYEAEDGTMFKEKEECVKYEATAKAVIYDRFKQLIVDEPFLECHIWERFGYGGEEFQLAVIEIKNEDDLNALNMFHKAYKFYENKPISSDFIGHRVLINLGYVYDGGMGDCSMQPRTEEQLIEDFKTDIKKFFYPNEQKKEG